MNGKNTSLAMLSLALLTLAPAAAQVAPPGSPAPSPPAPSPPTPFDRPVSWKRMIPNLASDQKKIWLFPLQVARGNDVVPTAAVLGASAGMVALDPTDTPYFRRTSAFGGFNRVFTSKATISATLAVPVSLYAAGLLRKDSKMQATALLAGEAVADTYLVTTVMKDIDRRLQPIAIPPNGNFADTWFKDNSRYGLSDGSFPSGHSIAAFSVATVVARRYGKRRRWIPCLAYGLAGVVGFSRITLSAHFVSDVFVGGVLGYSISRFTVLRQ